MEFERFNEIINSFDRNRIAVIGDFFLDKWLIIDRSMDEISIETQLTAYQVTDKRIYAGAAGTVINNLASLGNSRIYAIGFVGDDGEGYELLRELRSININIDNINISDLVLTPTYVKPMHLIDGRESESNRLDFKNVAKTPAMIELAIIESVRALCESSEIDALVCLDQNCDKDTGVLTERVRNAVMEIAQRHPEIIVYADSRKFIDKYRGVILKCNDKEAAGVFGDVQQTEFDIEKIYSYHRRLYERAGKTCYITCGEKGVVTSENGQPTLVPAFKVDGEIDIVGAGDACTAGIISSLCRGASAAEAAFIGNLCSSVTIKQIGKTGTVSQNQLRANYKSYYEKG